MISGLTLSAKTPQDLALKYLATLQALAYGTRLILDRLAEGGHQVFYWALGFLPKKGQFDHHVFSKAKAPSNKNVHNFKHKFW